MEWLKDAVVRAQRRELAAQWEDVAASVARLLADEEQLQSLPPAAAWHLLNGLQASLDGLEAATKAAREHSLPPAARRTTAGLMYGVNSFRDVLVRHVVPRAEKMYGPPPPDTRWEMTRG